jgi:hypothetical protein
MLFDEQAGTEKLFVVFSREPEPSLEKLIYSLRGPAPKTLMVTADTSVDDHTVGLLRTAYSRDLIVEKVDASTPAAPAGEKPETAVYVVNPTGAADSRLVADLRLEHR